MTSRVPAVSVSAFATPNVELAVNWRDVPLIVALKRFAVPPSEEVLVNVAVPAVAVRVPLTLRLDVIEKLAEVVIDPVTDKINRLIVPAPEIDLVVPLMVSVPPLEEKLPPTMRLPVILRGVVVVTVPLTLRLSSEMPVPLMVVPVPLIIKVPPDAWVKAPDPEVARFPVKVIELLEIVMEEAAIVRLLKFWVPVPPMELPVPVKISVLVFPVNVPLLIQLPPTECVKLPAINVVDAAIVILPLTVMFDAAVKETDVPEPDEVVKFPTIAKAVPGNVFTAAPLALLKVRLP